MCFCVSVVLFSCVCVCWLWLASYTKALVVFAVIQRINALANIQNNRTTQRATFRTVRQFFGARVQVHGVHGQTDDTTITVFIVVVSVVCVQLLHTDDDSMVIWDGDFNVQMLA